MAKISSYPIISVPDLNDLLIGTDVENLNETKNFTIGEIGNLIGQDYVPYVGATGNVNLGAFNIRSSAFIVGGGTASQFLKADGTLDSTAYTPQTRTLTINGTTYNLSANRSWDLNTIDSLTTLGTSGSATYIGKTLNIPVYQAQGNYITQLSGEATGIGPGNASVTLSNSAVISKVLTGLNITGGTVVSTDTILQAFGKIQNQINGIAGGVEYQGVWNAATNTPFLQSSVGTKGHYYVVNVAGNTNLNGITDWQVGDWAIYNGTAWDKVDNTDAVVSVNGYTGAVVLTASDVGAVPTTRTLTINGVGYNLSADRSWTVGDVRTDQSYINPSWISSLAWSKITSTPTTLAGYGITNGALNTTTLTINGTTFDLTANRSWSVGTVTSIGTSGPLTGGTITGSGTIGITQAGASSDGYLSSTDWNAFNSKQAAISVNAPLTFVSGVVGITQSGTSTDGYLSSTDWNTFNSKVSGSGTANTLPMWGSSSSLTNSPLSYSADAFNFGYNSTSGATLNFTNIGLTTYTYSIQMNNFGSPRSTIHSYTDGLVIQSIGGTQVSRMFANGNLILGTGFVDTTYKLTVSGDLYVNTIANAATDTDRFIVSDGGVIKYRTGAQVLSDIGAQGALTLTTIGSSGPATLISNTLNIPDYGSVLTGYVPYSGATQNVNLGEFGLTTGFLGFDLTPTNTPSTPGTMFWSADDETVDIIMDAAVTQKIGQETFYLVKNQTGTSIPKGTVVRADGTVGSSGRILIAPFLANGTFPSKFCIGVTTETIANGADGFVTAFGKIRQINTASYTEGAILYASPTSAGGFTTTIPQAPNNIVTVAIVITSSTNNGAIFVRPTFGSSINEDEGVRITSPVLNQGLFYDGSYWVNKTIAAALGYTPANQATTLTINGQTFDLSANRTWSVGTVTSVGLSVPTGFSIGSSPVTTSGTLALTFAAGYSLPTNASQTNWDTAYTNRITSLTTTGTSGAATLVSNVLNIPIYQAQGNYITSLTGEATASGPGAASVTLSNSAVTGKVLTGLTVAGSSIASTDSILSAFGKLQGQINDLIGGLQYQGTWNASTNTPTITSGVGTDGHFYIVSVAGNTTIDGITDWQIGDWIVFHGTAWQKVDNTESVVSVNGFTGAVNLTTSNISEGTNLYFTNSRARQAISLTTTGNSGASTYDNGTGVLNVPQYTLAGLGGVPTTRSLTINGTAFDLSADRSWSVGTVTSIATSGPITGGTITGTGTIGITQASSTTNGFLSSTDWNTFNSKQNTISLTTTGNSGVSTLIANVLNVPEYTLSGLGGVPTSRTLSINGVSFDLSSNRSWSVGTLTGSGTVNYVPKWDGSTSLTNSLIFDNGSGVGLNTASVNASALFQMDSTTRGFLPPRMTQAQRLAITSPAQGLIVYQTDSVIGLYIYSNSVWRSLTMV
jgi:predicted heme/steroid binding protein